jgi:katanin p60 ATPase-containing subunit A1
MDGVGSTGNGDAPEPIVMVLGATNYPWKIDEALRRRLEKRICTLTAPSVSIANYCAVIPLPDTDTTKELLRINLSSVALAENIDFASLAQKLQGYSGADITSVCRDAAMMPMRRRIHGLTTEEIKALPRGNFGTIEFMPAKSEDLAMPVVMQDFLDALSRIQSSVSMSDLKRYDDWMREFGSA